MTNLYMPIHVTYGNPPAPLRVVTNGIPRYYLSLDFEEKCAVNYVHAIMLIPKNLTNRAVFVLTGEEPSWNFEEYRTKQFSSLSAHPRKSYHALIQSLWKKTHQIIRCVYKDAQLLSRESPLLANYLKEFERAQSSCKDPIGRQGVVFCETQCIALGPCALNKSPSNTDKESFHDQSSRFSQL